MSSLTDLLKNNTQPTQQPTDPPAQAADPLQRVADADYNESGAFVLPGVYLCCIDVAKTATSRKQDFLWIVQLEILESSIPERPVGTRMDWIANFKHDPTPGNVKGFISASMGCTPEEVSYEATKLVASSQNPLHGRLVRVEATSILTKAQKEFTKVNFGAVSDDIQDTAGALREAAGFAPF